MSDRLLVDQLNRPLRDVRISVTDECNFRCTYCMPKELFGDGHPFLRPSSLLSFDEIAEVVRCLAGLGARKIKLTGGEPLLRPGIHSLVRRLLAVDGIEDLGLITNGSHLRAAAPALREAGLSRVTVSLDSLRPETFNQITGRSGGLSKVLEGIDTALELGFAPVKVNMVVQRGVNDEETLAMARHFRGTGVVLRFIEYMDVGRRNQFQRDLLVPSAEIRDSLDRAFGIAPVEEQYYGEVAERYVYLDGKGEVGFISSMTEPFCRNCTRIRLSADGKIYRCLFSGIGLDVKAILRDGADESDSTVALQEAIDRFWTRRDDRYSELRGKATGSVTPRRERVEMYRMGG